MIILQNSTENIKTNVVYIEVGKINWTHSNDFDDYICLDSNSIKVQETVFIILYKSNPSNIINDFPFPTQWYTTEN